MLSLFGRDERAECLYARYEHLIEDNADGNVENLIKGLTDNDSKARDALLEFLTSVRDIEQLMDRARQVKNELTGIQCKLTEFKERPKRAVIRELNEMNSKKKKKA